jgi:predicted negative regulator of RcsB-dependent stress response
MKRVVKKQLKEDEFVSTMTKIMDFFKTRTREVAIAAGVVAFLGLLYAGLRFIQAQNVKKESRLLTQMFDLRSELKTKPEDLEKLEQLASDGKFGRLAYVLTATYWIEQGDLEKARTSLEKIKAEPKDFIHYQAQDLLGQVNTLEKKYDQAIAIYSRIEEEKPKAYGLDVILFHKAEALEGKGETKDAVAVYKKLQEDFPQSYYGYDAGMKAKKLEVGL